MIANQTAFGQDSIIQHNRTLYISRKEITKYCWCEPVENGSQTNSYLAEKLSINLLYGSSEFSSTTL